MRRESFQSKMKEIDPALKLEFTGERWLIVRTVRKPRYQGTLSGGASVVSFDNIDVPVLTVQGDKGEYADVGTGVLRQLRDMQDWQNHMSAREYAQRRYQDGMREREEGERRREDAIDDMIADTVSAFKGQRFDMGRRLTR